MKAHQSKRILAIAIFLLLLTTRENLAQEIGATTASDDSNSGEAEENYIIPALEIVGFDFALNRFNHRYIDRESFNVSWSSVRRNLKSKWVVDNDEFATNQFLHPYQGSIYHTAARSAGLNYWTSAIYTFAGSALWEIAGETTRPSRNDQIASGIGGSFFGEPLFRMANLTLERGNGLPSFWRALGATAISPATGFNRLVFGERFDPIFPGNDPAFFTQWNFGSTVAEHGVEDTSQPRRNEGLAEFSMSYGLPGEPGYEYLRPFDHFNFEFTASTSNIFESIMTRGLLVGKNYSAGETYRGVWGLYGTYDYFAPEVFRVSNTGLSAGTTGQWGLPGPLTFQGSALAGMGYGTGGGNVGRVGDRDYHYGLTPQGLLAARLVFGKFVSLDVASRGYYITRFASTSNRGSEKIGRADASVTVRLFGPHALTVKYLMTRRLANYPDLGERDQRRGALSVFYTLVGDTHLGTVDWQPQ